MMADDERYKTNFSLCVICQEEKDENLIESPEVSSCDRLWKAICKRASYSDGKYPSIKTRLHSQSSSDFIKRKPRWHRTCYLALKCHEDRINAKSKPSFTRSKAEPHTKDKCFFCDQREGPKSPLFRVEKDGRQKKLVEAVEYSQNDTWLVKLSSAVDNKDASAIECMLSWRMLDQACHKPIKKKEY